MVKVHKQYINEWKSVNDDIKKVAETISNIIWYSSYNDKQMLDGNLGLMFISGSFPFYMKSIFKDGQPHFGVEKIDVEYRIYFFDTPEAYNSMIKGIDNSEYDVDTNKLKVICGSIEGYFNYTVTQEIYHELNHVFEYGMGMEKRVDLYDKVVSAMNDKNNDELTIRMCRLIYYTFPHEQDAFAHQFYGLMHSENLDGSFEELISNATNYTDFIVCRRFYKENCKRMRNDVNKILKYLGLDFEEFNKRVYFGGKRFEKKLYRVYQRHMYELRNKNIDIKSESRIETSKMLLLKEFRKRYKNINFDNGEYKW